ncbi:MAG: diacylglycerol kinase [Planctomycetaceae bacterium]|nr:diacylglycerol kinase [Planctomycetaceae bacterium]
MKHKHLRRPKRKTWKQKFADSFSGFGEAVCGQSSFYVHLPMAAAVIIAALLLGNFDTVRWSILFLCIAAVITAEMFNTSIELLARAAATSYNPHIRRALNVASAAVLVMSAGAAAVGIILFAEAVWKVFSGN